MCMMTNSVYRLVVHHGSSLTTAYTSEVRTAEWFFQWLNIIDVAASISKRFQFHHASNITLRNVRVYSDFVLLACASGWGEWFSHTGDPWAELVARLVLGQWYRGKRFSFCWGSSQGAVPPSPCRWPSQLHATSTCVGITDISRASDCERLGWCFPSSNSCIWRLQ